MSPEDIVRFQTDFQEQLARSHSWNLWGAAYVINTGCSDDCFEYFRAWLISRGRAAFDAVVANPDSLADLPDFRPGAEFEDILHVAAEAYRAKTGNDLPTTIFSKAERPKLVQDWDFDDDEELARRYPKLSRRMVQP